MNRRVERAKGDRSQEEMKDLDKQIDILNMEQKQLQEEFRTLSISNKGLIDEIRTVERLMGKATTEKDHLEVQIQELELENEMSVGDLDKVKKRKEDTLVQHDIMKLEIKKLKETVNVEADNVFGLENRKYQLEMSMEEREKEISVHKDILMSEQKAAEEERHKVAVELQQRKNKVKNLKIKYEGLVQKNKSTGDDGEGNVNEHSQAYYVIKAAQEREELQRYGDELDGKIQKCEKELKALVNTLNYLKGRNQNYRDKLRKVVSGAEGSDLEKKQILEEQCRAASETLFKKRREVQKLNKEYDDDMRRLMELQTRSQGLLKDNEDIVYAKEKLENEMNDQTDKINRAINSLNTKKNNLDSVDPNFANDHKGKDLTLEVEKLKSKYLLNAISILMNEIPDLKPIVEGPLQEKGIQLPSRPQTGVDRPASRSSRASHQ